MLLSETGRRATLLFPERVPEPNEAMSREESMAFAAWQASPMGLGFYSALAAHIGEELQLKSGRLLSVGDGEGLLSSQLALRHPGLSVVGTDLCPDSVRRAAARPGLPSNVSYRVADVSDLSGLRGFTAVVCVSALHHFADAGLAMDQMLSALSPGGQLYVSDLRRDADLGAYFSWLDLCVARDPLIKAKIFRMSVNAAYTRDELFGLLEVHEQRGLEVSVRPMSMPASALDAYAQVDPDARERWPSMSANMAGLMMQVHATVPG